MAPRFLVPNGLTALSFTLGLLSIHYSFAGDPVLGAWMIVWCVLLDKADGTAARLLKASSAFGTQFDSMTDLVAFGVAPAVLVHGLLTSTYEAGTARMGLLIGSGFYALCAAIRLARYNLDEASQSGPMFTGVPTTLCGALVSLSYLSGKELEILVQHLAAGPVSAVSSWLVGHMHAAAPALLILLGLLMCSGLKLPKLRPRRKLPFNIFQIVVVALCYFFGFFKMFPTFLLAVGVCYLIGGLLVGLLVFGNQEDAALPADANGDTTV